MLILLVASAVSAFTEEATHFLIVRVIRALKARGRGGRGCCLAFYGDRHLLWIRAATGFLLCRPGGHGAGLPLHGGIGQTGVLSMGEQWSPWTGEILIQTLHHDLAKALAKPATNLVWPSRRARARRTRETLAPARWREPRYAQAAGHVLATRWKEARPEARIRLLRQTASKSEIIANQVVDLQEALFGVRQQLGIGRMVHGLYAQDLFGDRGGVLLRVFEQFELG